MGGREGGIAEDFGTEQTQTHIFFPVLCLPCANTGVVGERQNNYGSNLPRHA